MKTTKRILAVLLSVCMLLSAAVISVISAVLTVLVM